MTSNLQITESGGETVLKTKGKGNVLILVSSVLVQLVLIRLESPHHLVLG